MSDELCKACGHSRALHSPFHDGYCIADKPYNGDFVCSCSRFNADPRTGLDLLNEGKT